MNGSTSGRPLSFMCSLRKYWHLGHLIQCWWATPRVVYQSSSLASSITCATSLPGAWTNIDESLIQTWSLFGHQYLMRRSYCLQFWELLVSSYCKVYGMPASHMKLHTSSVVGPKFVRKQVRDFDPAHCEVLCCFTWKHPENFRGAIRRCIAVLLWATFRAQSVSAVATFPTWLGCSTQAPLLLCSGDPLLSEETAVWSPVPRCFCVCPNVAFAMALCFLPSAWLRGCSKLVLLLWMDFLLAWYLSSKSNQANYSPEMNNTNYYKITTWWSHTTYIL